MDPYNMPDMAEGDEGKQRPSSGVYSEPAPSQMPHVVTSRQQQKAAMVLQGGSLPHVARIKRSPVPKGLEEVCTCMLCLCGHVLQNGLDPASTLILSCIPPYFTETSTHITTM